MKIHFPQPANARRFDDVCCAPCQIVLSGLPLMEETWELGTDNAGNPVHYKPMWLSGRDLTLSCFSQTKDAFTSVLSRPDVDPTLPAQQGQSAGERCAVHGKAGTQRLLVRLTDNAEGGQQTKLGDFDVGLAEFLVVDPRDESCETAKTLTSAREREKCVCAMNVMNGRVHNSMYIHLISFCVKERA